MWQASRKGNCPETENHDEGKGDSRGIMATPGQDPVTMTFEFYSLSRNEMHSILLSYYSMLIQLLPHTLEWCLG